MLSPEKGTKRKEPADTEYTEIEVVPKKNQAIPESECSVCHEQCYWRLSKTTFFGRCKDWECRGRAMILGRRVGDVEEGQTVKIRVAHDSDGTLSLAQQETRIAIPKTAPEIHTTPPQPLAISDMTKQNCQELLDYERQVQDCFYIFFIFLFFTFFLNFFLI